MILFWVTLLAISLLLYVLLDGFDLGVGMLFFLRRDEVGRRAMMNAIAPVWDGNETWLVVAAVILWGAFPLVYSVLLSAFYLPLLLMLAGLILRGVSFEFRAKAPWVRWSRACLCRASATAAANSAGSALLRSCVESVCASATRCSAPAGSSASVRVMCSRRPIA